MSINVLVLSFLLASSVSASFSLPANSGIASRANILPSGWSVHKNCIADSADSRLLSAYSSTSKFMTPSKCLNRCSKRGYSIGGLQNGNECYCDYAYTSSPVTKAAKSCTTPCSGDKDQTCGGHYRMASYKLKASKPTLPFPAGGQVIMHCVNPNHVALTFDDGPQTLSDAFTDIGGKATFFFNGNNYGCIYSQENMANIRYAYAAGHEMASHTWSHKDLATIGHDEIHDEMRRVEEALSRIIGVVPAYVRPPFGSYNDQVVKVAKERGQAIAIWDFDSLDWQYNTTEVLMRYDDAFDSMPQNLMALNHETMDRTPLKVMPKVLKKIKGMGYQLVTVSECMGTQAYQSISTAGSPDSSWTC